MLLTHLHETITKRAKTSDDLQKMLDVAGCVGVEAVDDRTVKASGDVKLVGLITPGTLPFTFEAGMINSLRIELGTLTSLKGLEALVVNTLIIDTASHRPNRYAGSYSTVANKLRSLKHCPKVLKKLNIRSCPELASLEGLQLGDGVEVQLTALPKLESLEHLEGVGELSLSSVNNVRLKNFPKSCTKFDIGYNKLARGWPWFILIPSKCKVVTVRASTFDEAMTNDLYLQLQDAQAAGGATRRDVLALQQQLIDLGFDKQAEMS